MHKNRLSSTLHDIHDVVLSNLGLTVHDHLITLDRNNLTGILIHEIFVPALQHTCSQLTSNHLLEVGLVNLHLLSEVEYLQDVLIGLKTNGTQQRCYGQLLLTVDIGIHDIVDVSSKLNPRALERNDTC